VRLLTSWQQFELNDNQIMKTNILENIANGFSNELVKETKSLVNDLTDEIYQILNQNIQKYFKTQIKLNKNVKNILYGSNPINIYDFYFPVNIKPTITIQWHTDTSSISNVFCRTNYLTIIGEAGCGKTTLTKFLFLDCLKKKFAIPVIIELRNLNNNKVKVIDYIKEKLLFFQVAENENILTRLLEKGKFVFFIDGYDELPHNIKSDVTRDLIKFVQKYSNNKYLLTSRPYSNAESLPLFQNYYVKELTSEQVDDFIKFQLKKELELSSKILASVKEARLKNLDEFLSNPLLLSLYILTFQYNSDIPSRKHIFYRRVIQTLFSEHDSISKSGFIRQTKSNLTQEQIEEVLKKFSFVSYFNNQFNFDLDYILPILKFIKENSYSFSFSFNDIISDLKGLSLWVEDSGVFSFNHRSIQEYFTALYVKELSNEEKKSIYDKLKSDFHNNSVTEVEHFLSLCEELDEIEYLRLFYIPIISSFSQNFKLDSDDSILKEVFPFFCQSIYKHSSYKVIKSHPLFKLPNIASSSEYNYIISIIKLELEKVYKEKILKEYWMENSLSIHNEFQRVSSKTSIDLFDEFPKDLLDYLKKNKELLILLKKFTVTLKLSMTSLIEYIESKRENNKAMLKMIGKTAANNV
jgi:predicted NACHT family NTPase